MSEKVSGYSLLGVGLLIMVFCVVNIVMVFTSKAKPFSVFNIPSNSSDINATSLNINDIVKQFQEGTSQSIPQPKIDILPPEVLNQTLNLSTHFFLMSFILGFGYKLSSLGIQLIRPINVKLRSQSPPIQPKV